MSALVDKWSQLYQQHEHHSVIEWHHVCIIVNAHRATIGHRFDRTSQMPAVLIRLKLIYNF
jgi:hypothetical protein